MKHRNSVITLLLIAFVLGFVFSAQAATIKATKVNGNIPTDPSRDLLMMSTSMIETLPMKKFGFYTENQSA